MKNKKSLYILLPLVLLIWGLILVKIFKQVKNSPDIDYSNQAMLDFQEDDMALDTFVIVAQYRDPFLGRSVVKRTENPVKVEVKPKTNPTNRPQRRIRNRGLRWPSISYNGVVSNEKKDKDLALISINNTSYIMRRGETNQDITLLAVYPDSVRLQYQDEKKTILKEN